MVSLDKANAVAVVFVCYSEEVSDARYDDCEMFLFSQ